MMRLFRHETLNFREFYYVVDKNRYPDYNKIVPNEMNLCRIEERLKMRYYRSVESVKFDLELFVSNSKLFNEPGCLLIQKAELVSEMFKIALFWAVGYQKYEEIVPEGVPVWDKQIRFDEIFQNLEIGCQEKLYEEFKEEENYKEKVRKLLEFEEQNQAEYKMHKVSEEKFLEDSDQNEMESEAPEPRYKLRQRRERQIMEEEENLYKEGKKMYELRQRNSREDYDQDEFEYDEEQEHSFNQGDLRAERKLRRMRREKLDAQTSVLETRPMRRNDRSGRDGRRGYDASEESGMSSDFNMRTRRRLKRGF